MLQSQINGRQTDFNRLDCRCQYISLQTDNAKSIFRPLTVDNAIELKPTYSILLFGISAENYTHIQKFKT
jgi:hypothetical protein